MSEPIAVLALRRKRDLISGTIAKYEKLLLAAQHDLPHVNSALRLFEVSGEAADLIWRIPKGPWMPIELPL